LHVKKAAIGPAAIQIAAGPMAAFPFLAQQRHAHGSARRFSTGARVAVG
jgi:hypothetical protein